MNNTSEPIIKLSDVSVGYRNNPVFTHLDLELPAGTFAGIVGPTGSGKTTLLKALLGTITPHGGKVSIMGREHKYLRPGTLGYVPQLESVDWSFPVTVEQVIQMGLYGKRAFVPWTDPADRQRVQQLAERLGIAGVLKSHIRDISGGQQQRTFLARALINNPQILVLDEPTSGVDIKTQHDVLHLLSDLNQDGITIVITSHDLNSVATHLPYVICFNQRIVAAGTPEEVFVAQTLSQTYGGDLMVLKHEGHILITHKKLSHHHHD